MQRHLLDNPSQEFVRIDVFAEGLLNAQDDLGALVQTAEVELRDNVFKSLDVFADEVLNPRSVR